MENGKSEQDPDLDLALKEAVIRYVIEDVPMDDDTYTQLTTGDNMHIIVSLVTEKLIDLGDEAMKNRLNELLWAAGQHTISARENQPIALGMVAVRR